MCGIPRRCGRSVRDRRRRTPRRTVRPGWASAASAKADSTNGRRPVSTSSSCPGALGAPDGLRARPALGCSAVLLRLRWLRPLRATPGFEDGPVAGQEEVGEPELVDSSSLPGVPRVSSPTRRGLRITLEDRHPVAVLRQQEGRAQADHASADDHDVSHDARGSRPVGVCGPRPGSTGRTWSGSPGWPGGRGPRGPAWPARPPTAMPRSTILSRMLRTRSARMVRRGWPAG